MCGSTADVCLLRAEDTSLLGSKSFVFPGPIQTGSGPVRLRDSCFQGMLISEDA